MSLLKKNFDRNFLILILVPIVVIGLLSIFFNFNPLVGTAHLAVYNDTHSYLTLDGNNSYSNQALGHLAAIMWLHGEVPWWNPYEGLGMPLVGEMQSAAFSPFTLLLYFSNGETYLHLIFQIIAGLGTYLFLQKLKITKNNALVGALLFEFNAVFAWMANAALGPIPFLPFLLYGIEQMISSAELGQKKGWRCFAISLTLSIYAGFPEVAYINCLFVLSYALVRMLALSRKTNLLLVKKALLGVLVGLLLAAPIIIAFLDFLNVADTAGHLTGDFQSRVIPIHQIMVLVMPLLYGKIVQALFINWNDIGGYFSLLVVFLGFWSLQNGSNLRLKVFLLVWIIITVAAAHGIQPFHWMIIHFPLLGLVAFARYYSVTSIFAVTLLCVFALQDLEMQKFNQAKIRVYMAVFLLVFFVLFFWANFDYYHSGIVESHLVGPFYVSISWAIISLSIIFWAMFKQKLKVVKVLLVFDAILFFCAPLTHAPTQSSIEMKGIPGVEFLQEHLGLHRFYSVGPIAPNYGSYFGIASMNYYDIPVPKNLTTYVMSKLDPYILSIVFSGTLHADPSAPSPLRVFIQNQANFEEAGVKYLVTQSNVKTPLFLAYHDSFMNIYSLPHPKPYFEVISGHCDLQVISRTLVNASCSEPSILLRRELFMSGWTVMINHHAVVEPSAHDIFQAVNLPAGNSALNFQFLPPHIKFAGFGFLLGLLLVIF